MTTPPPWGEQGSDPQWNPPGGSQPPPDQSQPGWPASPPLGQYPPPYYPPPRPTNGMAIASMVLGIIWIYWIGSILALVFGYIAKRQIKERGEGGGGMATAGIVLGWIGVAILVIFVVIFVIAGVNGAFEEPGFDDSGFYGLG